jgi:hypothetical protein
MTGGPLVSAFAMPRGCAERDLLKLALPKPAATCRRQQGCSGFSRPTLYDLMYLEPDWP